MILNKFARFMKFRDNKTAAGSFAHLSMTRDRSDRRMGVTAVSATPAFLRPLFVASLLCVLAFSSRAGCLLSNAESDATDRDADDAERDFVDGDPGVSVSSSSSVSRARVRAALFALKEAEDRS